MGTIRKGILGPVNGTVGTVVGSRWRGIDYIRSRPGKRTSAPTAAQAIQQAKFSLVTGFLQTMKAFLDISYKNVAVNMTGPNAALAQVMREAVTGIYPGITIDFSKVEVSAGAGLLNADAPTAASAIAGKIDYHWTDNSNNLDAKTSDKAMVLAYCDDLKKTVYNTAAAQRSDLTAVLNVPAFSGLAVHTWIVFISENGKKISAGLYTGMVTVQ